MHMVGYTDEVPELKGMFYQDVDKLMIQKLKDAGALLKLKVFTHSYPHDWRTKKQLSLEQLHNGLLQFLHLEIKFLIKLIRLNSSLHGVRHVCTT